MILTGLVSVTFRKLKPIEIVDLVLRAGLSGIEWGGDIHVPHGDISIAREVHRMTEESGLCVASYGSYYRVGCEDQNLDGFKAVLETAVELKAPAIRVWAGDRGSKDADDTWWDRVVKVSREIGDMAAKANITVSYEYHGNTLTDTNETALRLLQKVAHENIKCYWQPPVDMDFQRRMEGLKNVEPWLTNVHAFHWVKDKDLKIERCPFSEGLRDWKQYINVVKETAGQHYVMIEFVKDDEPEQFLKDAEILKNLI